MEKYTQVLIFENDFSRTCMAGRKLMARFNRTGFYVPTRMIIIFKSFNKYFTVYSFLIYVDIFTTCY